MEVIIVAPVQLLAGLQEVGPSALAIAPLRKLSDSNRLRVR
jgi:hypothetical protein